MRWCGYVKSFPRRRIVEQGSHDQLIAANGAYATLYNAQFSGTAVVDPASAAR